MAINTIPGTAAATESQGAIAQLYNAHDLPSLLQALFTTAISVGAILAVIRIAYAGYLYLKGDVFGYQNKQNAKQVLQDAVLGLVLLLAVWLILHTINPDLLNLNILRSVQPAPTN